MATLDGKGNYSAVGILNVPNASGQRVLITTTSSGTYTVNPNGTALLIEMLTPSNGAGTVTNTEDVLITRAKVTDHQKVATEYVSMQRELAFGTFATFVATRRPDTMTHDEQ